MSASEVSLNLKAFDMKRVGTNKSLIFIGSRHTGKTSGVLDYLHHNQDIPNVTIISPTDKFDPTYKQHMPNALIHDEYTTELVDKFLKRQIITTKCARECKCVDPRGILILDECLYDSNCVKDPNIKWIFFNGRFAKITFIMVMQYCTGIPPALRNQVDFIFIFKEPKMSNRKRLFEHYCSIFPTFDMFNQVLTAVTNDYGCLVIDNCSISDKLDEQVFWYRANIHDDFRMCSEIELVDIQLVATLS